MENKRSGTASEASVKQLYLRLIFELTILACFISVRYKCYMYFSKQIHMRY
jgi:hypothetical protein